MVNKNTLIVTVLLIIGAAAVLISDKFATNSSSKDGRVHQSIVDGFNVMELDKITLSEGPTTLTLSKGSDKQWMLDDGFPADISKVLSILEQIEKTKVQRIVARQKSSFIEFGLDAPKVATFFKGGKVALKVNLGDDRKGGGQYIAFGSEEKAYLVDQVLKAQTAPDSWELHKLVDIKKENIAQIDFKNVTLAKAKKDAAFTIAGVDEKDMSPAAKSQDTLMSGLTFQNRYGKDFADGAAALAKAVTVKVKLFDNTTYSVKVGTAGDEKAQKHFMDIQVQEANPTSHGKWLNGVMQKHTFEISKWQADKFRKSRSDFVVAKKS